MSQNNWNLNDLGPQMLKDIAVEKARADSRLRIFSGTANPQLAQVGSGQMNLPSCQISMKAWGHQKYMGPSDRAIAI